MTGVTRSSSFCCLVVFCVDFEIGLRMGAGGAQLGGLDTHDDVTAVAAFPNSDLALGKDLSGLHVLKQCAVALLVVLLDGGDHAELGGQGREALLVSGLGKAVVHIGPFVVLALGSGQQVLSGVANAFQFLEPQLGMLLLIISGLQEQGSDPAKAAIRFFSVWVPAYLFAISASSVECRCGGGCRNMIVAKESGICNRKS